MAIKVRDKIEFEGAGGRKAYLLWNKAEGRFEFSIDGDTVATIDDTGGMHAQRAVNVPALNAKVGATAGWVITGGTNISLATLPASQTASTLVIPISGLDVGDVINSVEVRGQADSAGNAITLVAAVMKVVNDAAGGHTNTSVKSVTLLNAVTADTLLDGTSGLITLDTPMAVAANEQYYVLLTGTTTGTTDIEISHLIVNIN